jgi:hypothetical protein
MLDRNAPAMRSNIVNANKALSVPPKAPPGFEFGARPRRFGQFTLALLELQELGACAFLRDLHIAQHGILADDKGMRIARLACCQGRELGE